MSGIVKDRGAHRHMFVKVDEYDLISGEHVVVGRCPCGEWQRSVVKE
jgi:hypothetical protein